MLKYWKELMFDLQIDENINSFEQLKKRYSEKHRHYHTFIHIKAMLDHFNDYPEKLQNGSAIKLAIWFHDAIYNPYSKNNERRSARLAKKFCISNELSKRKADDIYNLITATKAHDFSSDYSHKILIDIDLSIFGSNQSTYKTYEENIRLEYKYVPKRTYIKNRKLILSKFFKQKSIYQTEFFRMKFEDKAKANIQSALQLLTTSYRTSE